MSWTEDRVEQLKSLWADGQSASAIATTLGEVSRNAVIGKVHRLGLAGRPKESTPRSRRRSSSTQRLRGYTVRSSGHRLPTFLRKNVHFHLPELGPSPQERITIATLTVDTCRWPEGDPKTSDFYFCGRPKSSSDGPYCRFHTIIARQQHAPSNTPGMAPAALRRSERTEADTCSDTIQ